MVIVLTENMSDPLDAASNVYRYVMENDRVRVLRVTFQIGDIAVMHHHPDHVVYVLNGGKVKITSHGKTDDLDLKTGEAVFLNAQSHEVQNISNSILDLIVVELKK